jgi:uncharacterized membrane protein YebE (DUF533 family)
MGIDKEAQEFFMAEMRKPMNTDALVNAAAGRPGLAAQLYAASLLAIEVDTPAERDYLNRFGEHLGLNPTTLSALENTVGMQNG